MIEEYVQQFCRQHEALTELMLDTDLIERVRLAIRRREPGLGDLFEELDAAMEGEGMVGGLLGGYRDWAPFPGERRPLDFVYRCPSGLCGREFRPIEEPGVAVPVCAVAGRKLKES